MLDVKFICENPDLVRRNCAAKGEKRADIDGIIALQADRKRLLQEVEKARTRINALSKEIGAVKKRDPKADISAIQKTSREVGDAIKATEEELKQIQSKLDDLLQWIPNIADEDVPVGPEETANKVVRTWGEAPSFGFKPKPHWDIGKGLGILDEERSGKISGSNFLLLKGAGARLERALISFMLDLHTTKHGYTEIWAPVLANRDSLLATGQLPKLEDDMYRLERDDMFLIPTAEVPITNLHRNEILRADELPLKYTGYTACFRREAGAYSQETRGMQRIHQFDKVEMVKLVPPDDSAAELESLVANAEEVLQVLGLPYRVVLLSTEGTTFASAKTYDIEAWAPGLDRWLEVSSCSNFREFQARRLKTRFRGADKKVRHVHTLNGSGLALPRTVIALLENGQREDGSVVIPEPLRPYLGGRETL